MNRISVQTKRIKIIFLLLSSFTLFFQLATAQDSPPVIQYLNIEPLVVNSNEHPFSIFLEIEEASYDSIVITGLQANSSTGEFLAISEGQRTGQVTLLDQGTGEDPQANDGIYTSPLIIWDWVGSYKTGIFARNILTVGGDILFYKNGQETGYYNIKTNLNLIKFDFAATSLPTLTKINDSIQHTSHVINIITDQKFHEEFSSEIRNEKLDIFGDYFLNDNAELIFAYLYPTNVGNVAAYHRNYNNDVENICLSQFESSVVDYAEGITVMAYGNMNPSLFAHEYLHRYAAHCDDHGYISSGHWGPIEYETTGFYSSGKAIEQIDSTTFLVKELRGRYKYYNDLEMYLCGLLPLDQIDFPIRYLKNAQLLENNASAGTATYTGELVSFDKESFLAAHGGKRVPEFEPNLLKTSTVVFSNRFLKPEEIYYYHSQTVQMSNLSTDNSSSFNVYRATQGRLFHQTELRLKPAEEPTASNDIATIVETYPWIEELINTDTCSDEAIKVYGSGLYQYIQIEAGGVKTLYNQDGQFYCENSSNFDCVEAYNLTDLLLTGTCEATPAMDAIPSDEEMPSDEEILYRGYPWLEALLSGCEEETVEIFKVGIYHYVYIRSAEKSVLYNEDGLVYCTSSPNYDCLEVYNLSEVSAEWNCKDRELTGGGVSFAGIPFFETIPWLPKLEEIKDCPRQFGILLYLLPGATYFFVEVPSISSLKMYDQDGNLVCVETEETDCRKELDLSGGFFYVFNCGGNLVEVTDDTDAFTSLPTTFARVPDDLNPLEKTTISPNPFQDFIILDRKSFPLLEVSIFSLYDAVGREVMTSPLQNYTQHLSTTNLDNGLYFYQIKTESGRMISNGKMVKQ